MGGGASIFWFPPDFSFSVSLTAILWWFWLWGSCRVWEAPPQYAALFPINPIRGDACPWMAVFASSALEQEGSWSALRAL